MITPEYEYSFGVRNLPVGQIVNVARRDISIPEQPWKDVGSYFSVRKNIPIGKTYSPGPNAKYERLRNATQ